MRIHTIPDLAGRGDIVPQKTRGAQRPVQSAVGLITVHAITGLEQQLACSPRLEMQKVASSFHDLKCW